MTEPENKLYWHDYPKVSHNMSLWITLDSNIYVRAAFSISFLDSLRRLVLQRHMAQRLRASYLEHRTYVSSVVADRRDRPKTAASRRKPQFPLYGSRRRCTAGHLFSRAKRRCSTSRTFPRLSSRAARSRRTRM